MFFYDRDLPRDVICLFLLFKYESLYRTVIADIFGYTNNYVKQKLRELVEKEYLIEEYDKNRVVYKINKNRIEEIRKKFLNYCEENRAKLNRLIEEYKIKGGVIFQPSLAKEPQLSGKSLINELTHKDVQKLFRELGEALGYEAIEEFQLGNTRLDVVWKKYTIKTAIEIVRSSDEYNIVAALFRLKEALEKFNVPSLVIVVFNYNTYNLVKKRLYESASLENLKNHLRIINLEEYIRSKRDLEIIKKFISLISYLYPKL
jgi:DNA-binding transcriptional ArsR family regulator